MKLSITEDHCDTTQEPQSFPLLMIASDTGQIIIALGTARPNRLIGVNVNGKGCEIGYKANTYIASLFKPYNGKLTLNNT